MVRLNRQLAGEESIAVKVTLTGGDGYAIEGLDVYKRQVQVGSVPSSMTSLCPLAGISFCAVSTSLQAEQCLPSVRPAFVQVGSTRSSMTLSLIHI